MQRINLLVVASAEGGWADGRLDRLLSQWMAGSAAVNRRETETKARQGFNVGRGSCPREVTISCAQNGSKAMGGLMGMRAAETGGVERMLEGSPTRSSVGDAVARVTGVGEARVKRDGEFCPVAQRTNQSQKAPHWASQRPSSGWPVESGSLIQGGYVGLQGCCSGLCSGPAAAHPSRVWYWLVRT